MKFIALAGLALALGFATFQRAGVDVGDWCISLIAVGVTSSAYFLIARRREVPGLDRYAGSALAVFIFIAAFQLVPLPVALVRVLSPARVELLSALTGMTGSLQGSVQLSAVPHKTAIYLLTTLGYLAVFLVIRDIAFMTSSTPWAMVWPLLVVGGLEASLGFHQAYVEGGEGYATGTYANRDHFAGLLELILPFAAMYPVAILARNRKRHESPALPALQACGVLAIAAVLLIGIIHSLSRMGFIVALAALFISACMALGLGGWRIDPDAPAPLWRRWFPTLLVTAVVILGFIFLPTDPLIARFADFAKTDDITADTRAQLWRETMGLIKTYPLFGCGLGGYESCFYKFKIVAPMNTADYAHNDYLQVLAEMGVFGFLSGLMFVARSLQRTVHGALYARSIDERYLAIACTSSITGMLMHSFVDFNMYVPANGFVFAWVVGIAGLNLRQRDRPSAPKVTSTPRNLHSENEPALKS